MTNATNSYMFRDHANAVALKSELEELNSMVTDNCSQDDCNTIDELFEELLDSTVQCRHRYCGTCDGVGCENSHYIKIPVSLFQGTKAVRDRADYTGPSAAQEAQWKYDDEGRCHW